MFINTSSSTSSSQDGFNIISIIAQNQESEQQFQKDIAKQFEDLEKQKNDKKIQDQSHHSMTRQPISIQKNLSPPFGLIGRLFMKNINTQLIEQQVQLGTCFFITKDCAIASAHQMDHLDEKYELFIKIPKDELGEVKVNIKQSYYQSYKNDPIVQNDYLFLKVNLSKQQEQRMDVLLKKNEITFSQPLEDNDKNISFNGEIYGFIKKIPEYLESIIDNYKKDQYEKCLIKSQSQMHSDGKGIDYSASTLNGMSGSPIFIRKSNKLIVVGIHICGNFYQQKNYGLFFTAKHYKELKNFLKNPVQLCQQSIKAKIKIQYSFQEIIEKIGGQTLYNQLEIMGKYVIKILHKVQSIEEKSIFIQSLTDKNIIIDSKDNIQLKNLSLCYNCLIHQEQKQSIDPKYLYLNYLDKFLNQNKFIKNILLKFSYQKIKLNPTKHHHVLSFIVHLIKKKRYVFTYQLNRQIKRYQTRMTEQPQQIIQRQIIQNSPQKIFLEYFKMDAYMIDSFEMRAQRFCILLKYSSKKLSKISFLRIYMITVLTLYANLKCRIDIINKLYPAFGKQFLNDLKKIDEQISNLLEQGQFKEQQKVGKMRIFYLNLFKDNNILEEKKIINRLIDYQNMFIEHIAAQINKIIKSIQKLDCSQYFNKYNNSVTKPELKQIKLKYNLHQFYDNLAQNVNRQKIEKESKRVFYKDIKILSSIFDQKQSNDYIYRITNLKPHEYQKYQTLLNRLVRIRNKNSQLTVGSGFIISQNLICTALHVFGSKIANFQQLQQAIQGYQVVLKDGSNYDLVDPYPRQIKQQSSTMPQFRDIAVVRIKGQFKGQKFPIIHHPRKFNYSQFKQKRQFAMILGFGQSQSKKIVYKKSIGQITLSSCLPASYRINLTADQVASGSPVLIKSKSTALDHIALGVYTGTARQQCQNAQRYGKYSKFNYQQQFKDLQNQKFFQPVHIDNYNQFFNEQRFKQYVNQHYGNIDHFLLRIIAEILKLNHFHLYLKQLKIQNLILNKDDNLNIFFTNLNIVKKNCIILPQEVRQHREIMQFIISQSEKINLKTFFKFIHKLHTLFKQDKFSSIFLAQLLDSSLNQHTFVSNYKTLNQFIQNLDENYKIIKINKKKNFPYFYLEKKAFQTKQKVSQFTYYDVIQRYFFWKPKYRLEKLLLVQNLLQNPSQENLPMKLMKNQFRQVNTKRTIQSRFRLLKKNLFLNQLNKQERQLSHFTFLSKFYAKKRQIIEKIMLKDAEEAKRLKNVSQDIYPNTQKIKDYEQKLQILARGMCLKRQIIKNFINYEKLEFIKYYSLINKWKNIEDIIQQVDCLSQIKNDNLIIKKEQTQDEIYADLKFPR